MELNFYLEKAKEAIKVNSYNKLAGNIGISHAAISNFLTGRAYPADATILKLAALAGISPEIALIDVSIWRNKDNPEALKFWENIRAKISEAKN